MRLDSCVVRAGRVTGAERGSRPWKALPRGERAAEARAAARGVATRCTALVRALGLPLPPRPAAVGTAGPPAADRAPAAGGAPAACVVAPQDGAPHPGGATFFAAPDRCADEAQHSHEGGTAAGAAPPLPCARPATAGLHRDTGAAGQAGATDGDMGRSGPGGCHGG